MFLLPHILDFSDLVYPSLMTAAFKFRIEKYVHELDCSAGADYSGAEAQGGGIVMQQGIFSAEIIGAAGGADPFYLIGSHRNTDTCTAAEDGFICFARNNQVAGFFRLIRIIYRIGIIRTAIGIFNTVGVKIGPDLFFERKPRMVGTECNHCFRSPFKRSLSACGSLR